MHGQTLVTRFSQRNAPFMRFCIQFGVRFAAKRFFSSEMCRQHRSLKWVSDAELDPYLALMQIVHEIVCKIVRRFEHV
jgi:hypothetical protein